MCSKIIKLKIEFYQSPPWVFFLLDPVFFFVFFCCFFAALALFCPPLLPFDVLALFLFFAVGFLLLPAPLFAFDCFCFCFWFVFFSSFFGSFGRVVLAGDWVVAAWPPSWRKCRLRWEKSTVAPLASWVLSGRAGSNRPRWTSSASFLPA